MAFNFSKITNQITKIAKDAHSTISSTVQSVIDDSGIADDLISSNDIKNKFFYESDADALQCRECKKKFDLIRRKHHCRSCYSCFCESCCNYTVNDKRGCIGCQRNQTPGEQISKYLEHLIKAKNITVDKSVQGETLDISYGSYERKASLQASPEAPAFGYFEIINKSDFFACVKVLTKGNFYNEATRPCYFPLPPNESVHGEFSKFSESLDVYLLVGNDSPALDLCNYDPYGNRKLSPCASTVNFGHVMHYTVPNILGKNVLLKYKNGGELTVRHCDKKSKILLGVFGFSGGDKKKSLDNNVDVVVKKFSSLDDYKSN